MVKCAIIGGSGYIGGELIRLLSSHPKVDLVAITANESAGSKIADTHPNLRHLNLHFNSLYDTNNADVLFLALPHGKAEQAITHLPNKTIIDTSTDFRFCSNLDFSYGLPELFRKNILHAKHIASPGCFATAAILSVYPLVAEALNQDIVINAVTGSSGAGIKPKDTVHHPFRSDSFFAYELFTHRHIPEIKKALHSSTDHEVDFIFQPHSGPFVRGIYATSFVKLTREISKKELVAIFEKYYASEYFIRFTEQAPNIKWVQGTNFCDMHIETNGKTAIITTAIDNLLKGGAAQAVQCFNIMQKFPESTGLEFFGLNP